YKVLKEYELPTYVFPNNVFKERLGWSQGKAAQWAEIPCILFPEIHVRESNILHETQHITFGLLVRSKVVPYDKSMKENDIRDFLMYKNEILSQIIENVIPIGYSHAQFGSKVSTYVKMQTRFLYYLIKLLVKSSKNKGLQVQDFIYVVFSSETFEDLFERTLRIATGIEVSQLEIDEIDFPNKRSRVKFMKCIRRIREKKIVSKVDGWGQAIT
ncbi:MAG: hypothetical protein QF824_06235, partial [Candidatus Woesearchaeota archaeon]|nr:hypothetical protein [Candidatus Woesearchaeota archaeon]